jgi:hypothetical protein
MLGWLISIVGLVLVDIAQWRCGMFRWFCLTMLALVAWPSVSAEAQDSAKCKIGRPAYCYKHGGTLCQTTNTTNAVGACDAWTNACLECHEAIDACLGNRIRLRSAPVCSKCDAAWSACMRKIDRRYWPNRQKPQR